MSTEGDKPPNLTRQRILIVVFVVVALFLAISTIYNTLSNQGPGSPTVEAPATPT